MAQTVLHVGLLLVVLCVADCESATPEDSHCSYTFIVPAGDCRQTPGEDQLLKSSLIALQAQVKLLAWQLRNAPVDIVKLVNDVNEVRKENAKLRQKIAVIEAGRSSFRHNEKILCCNPVVLRKHSTHMKISLTVVGWKSTSGRTVQNIGS